MNHPAAGLLSHAAEGRDPLFRGIDPAVCDRRKVAGNRQADSGQNNEGKRNQGVLSGKIVTGLSCLGRLQSRNDDRQIDNLTILEPLWLSQAGRQGRARKS
jgi:hypothetical protein